ncbi:MAG: hypothetical protein H0U87_08225 [Acidobacteria bacterium]|jgi:hypothetical protein|nr:hypothetical protein [Acidobacteriota bacterium]
MRYEKISLLPKSIADAFVLTNFPRSRSISFYPKMELDKQAQEAVRRLGSAVNSAIEKSADVTRAIDEVRALGYEPHLTLKLEIALQEIGSKQNAAKNSVDFMTDGDDGGIEETAAGALDEELELTDEDVRTLRRMKIRFE